MLLMMVGAATNVVSVAEFQAAENLKGYLFELHVVKALGIGIKLVQECMVDKLKHKMQLALATENLMQVDKVAMLEHLR